MAPHAQTDPATIEYAVDGDTLAEILGVHYGSVCRMASSGVIPSLAVGAHRGTRRYFLSDVKRALHSAQPIAAKGRFKMKAASHAAMKA